MFGMTDFDWKHPKICQKWRDYYPSGETRRNELKVEDLIREEVRQVKSLAFIGISF